LRLINKIQEKSSVNADDIALVVKNLVDITLSYDELVKLYKLDSNFNPQHLKQVKELCFKMRE